MGLNVTEPQMFLMTSHQWNLTEMCKNWDEKEANAYTIKSQHLSLQADGNTKLTSGLQTLVQMYEDVSGVYNFEWRDIKLAVKLSSCGYTSAIKLQKSTSSLPFRFPLLLVLQLLSLPTLSHFPCASSCRDASLLAWGGLRHGRGRDGSQPMKRKEEVSVRTGGNWRTCGFVSASDACPGGRRMEGRWRVVARAAGCVGDGQQWMVESCERLGEKGKRELTNTPSKVNYSVRLSWAESHFFIFFYGQ